MLKIAENPQNIQKDILSLFIEESIMKFISHYAWCLHMRDLDEGTRAGEYPVLAGGRTKRESRVKSYLTLPAHHRQVLCPTIHLR